MQKKSTFILLTILLCFKGYSQFIVTQQSPVTDYFFSLLTQSKPNQFQFIVIRDKDRINYPIKNHQILTYDFNGQLLDSVNIPTGYNPISYPLKSNGYYYMPAVYLDTLASPVTFQDSYVLKFDSLFNFVQKRKLNNINQTIEIATNIININKKLFVAVKNFINNDLKIYTLDTQLNKRDSVTFSGNYDAIELRKTFDEKILIAGNGFPCAPNISGPQKIIIDTLLQTNSIFNFDSLTYVTAGGTPLTGCSSQIGVNMLFFKAIPITTTKNFIMGHYDVIYNASCNSRYNLVHTVIDNANKIIQTTLISDSTRSIRYADNTNNVEVKDSYIYSVGSAGLNGGLLEANNSSILICKSDTMGNLIWKKQYGDDMFYRPISIIQTLDSGFLVSGLRYNYQAPAYIGIGDNFILRVNKSGDLVSTGIKEQGSKNFISFSCFPNPTKDVVYFDVFLTSNYQLEIFDILGKSVYQDKNYQNKSAVSIEFLNTGQYIYKLKTKESFFTGKIIKE